MKVSAKKHLGQHFLNDKSVCQRITKRVMEDASKVRKVLEVGPGMGALTEFLLKEPELETHVIEIDRESVAFLQENVPQLKDRIHALDFLKVDLNELMGSEPFAVVGNFPYNISTQILFKVLDFKDQVPCVVGMFQKEVAQRVVEPPGTKKYGITSVFLQAFYDVEYLFTVPPEVFTPPPKVDSGVISLTRNDRKELDCDSNRFRQVVKMAFNLRRKTLRNSLKSMILSAGIDHNDHAVLFSRRPETLSVQEFIDLTNLLTPKE